VGKASGSGVRLAHHDPDGWTAVRATLLANGDIGRDLLNVDWDATPLGQPEEWPRSLQNAVRILLTSRFSMWLAWGPDLTFFCNEAYRRDTLGAKYPWALGRPASEVWSEIWDDIGPRIDRVMTDRVATWDESLLLFLERSGYVEETYHTFSYSPLADDDGVVEGMLCVVKEDTEQVVAARRLATLRDLGSRAQSDLEEADTIASACAHLAGNSWSVPFSLIYLFDADTTTARLAGASHVPTGHQMAVPELTVGDDFAAWPVTDLAAGKTVVVENLGERFADVPCGPWKDPATQALATPLTKNAQSAPYGFIVVGLNRYRPLDESYRVFVQLVAGQIAAAISDARTFEFERRRAEALAELDQAKTDFFTNVSHEFRTPLTLLLGPAEDALVDESQPLPPDQRERVEVIHRNGQRLLRLVNSLLEFSRLEAGRADPKFEPVELDRYTAELARMFTSAAESAGLNLTIDCQPLAAAVWVDRDQWAKIVLNLLSNALKFTFDGGIAVGLCQVGSEVELTVSDTGTGIPEQEIDHLFERFHRVHGATSRSYEGSGIGLALVSELAAVHGGVATVESAVGVGTTFTVRIPLRDRAPGDQAVTSSRQSASVGEQARGFVLEAMRWVAAESEHQGSRALDTVAAADAERPRVLVVDDNADMRHYMAGVLAAEYEVQTATDGLEALRIASQHAPDLVVTDVMMPHLDGFGLLRALHDDPRTVGLPVLMVSARGGEDGTIEGLEAGADDYLVKPFSGRELLARVRVNLELDRTRRTRRVLEHGQELLDQAQRLAKVGSWEADVEADVLLASPELQRILGRTQRQINELGLDRLVREVVHPDDIATVQQALAGKGSDGAATPGDVIAYDARVAAEGGAYRLVHVRAQLFEDETTGRRLLRGSLQDVTQQRDAELALAASTAREEASAREHAIADELQRSLLPERVFDLEHLDVATYYRAGVEGTQVGGDWYDIIDLGAGRTALVVGDVMGRGVRAAAVMGQLRSAVRAFAKLGVAPVEVLEHLDSMVQDLGDDQIVTCVYAVFDSTDQTLVIANAGHLPPLLVVPGEPARRLAGSSSPPLGTGVFGGEAQLVKLRPGSIVTFYTDGLVERRGRDLDVGIDAVARALERVAGLDLAEVPERLVEAGMPEGPDDDVALLLARVNSQPFAAALTHRFRTGELAASSARRLVESNLQSWGVHPDVTHDVVLMASELVTNAMMHGRSPIDLLLRSNGTQIVLEVQDRGAYRPRRKRPNDDDERGRGLNIVAQLADQWGSRSTANGKSVWATRSLV
jgi:signal transduction histidine kinase/DNA-binding response OmpR family regulator/serine phosphatase RsbU (regulator of sigma subunit)/anti-sigma regulatory factor (Ser/Thr protein kinase)